MLNHFILHFVVIWNYKGVTKNHSFTFYIELCRKYVEVGVNLALLENVISMVTPIFYFFLKGIMIVHVTKTKI